MNENKMKKEELLKKFDLKIGSVITPHELANVFQWKKNTKEAK